MRTSVLTIALSFSIVACGSSGTLKIGEGDANDGMVDTDGDGIPDSPDSDGDGIADDDDDEPDIPNDDDDDDDEEEDPASPFAGEYDGGLSLEIWDMGYSYCSEDSAEFVILDSGEFTGEGWCFNDWYNDEVTLEYTGLVDDNGSASGSVYITLWLPAGHGDWEQDTVEFELDGGMESNKLLLDFEGAIGRGSWGFEVSGDSWGTK